MSSIPKRIVSLGIVAAAAIAGRGIATVPQADPPRQDAGRTPLPRAFGPIHPQLSLAGDQIVFSYQGAIWRMPRAGGAMTQLSDGRGFDIEPAWSPDGERIAFINTPGFGAGRLRLIQSGDGTAVPLPKEVGAFETLAFAPGGKRLLGKFQEPDRGLTLAWLDLDTGALVPVATGALRPQRFALSHDGGRIAFTTNQDVPGEQSGNDGPESDLWMVPSEGGEPSNVVRFPARIFNLGFEAKGRALVVATDLGGAHYDLWEVPLDDPERGRRLTFGQADEDRPSCSADGRWLVHSDNHLGPTGLVVRDLSTDSQEMLQPAALDFRRPTGRLTLSLVDAVSRSPVVGRVALRHEGGKYHAPIGSLYRLARSDLHAYVDGRAELELPEGLYEASVARGPEYRIARLSFDVRAGQAQAQSVTLERWTDERARGWHSGESHIHANYGYGPWYNSPRTMLLQSAGEDLGVSNFMVANSDGDGVFDREHFRGRPDPLSDDRTVLYWNEEFRSTVWGHMTLLNLKHLVEPIFTGFLRTTHPYDVPTNSDVADLTHDEEGLANYTHPAADVKDPYNTAYSAKALPMDVALGKIDSVDVMGQNYEAVMPLWYGLLNCGFRLPASAGTDCFLNRIPSRLPGSDRVYVQLDGPFSYGRWSLGLKAGRTFVTNGPMLDFSAEGRGPGETLKVSPGGRVRVRGKVRAQYPLDRLEVIQDGRVVAQAKAAGDGLAIELEELVAIDRSGWLALRAYGLPHRDQLGAPPFGHTSVVYVDVSGRPVDAREAATGFVAWIDRLAAHIRRRGRVPSRSREHVEAQLAAARAVYDKMLVRP